MTTIEKIQKEAAKAKTTTRTYKIVQEFWTIEEEVSLEIIDTVRDLEKRMKKEHGWS